MSDKMPERIWARKVVKYDSISYAVKEWRGEWESNKRSYKTDEIEYLRSTPTLEYAEELVTQLQKYRDAKKELQRFERTETFQKCPTSHEWMKRKMDIDCAMIIMMDILSQIERETVEGGG